MAEIVRGEEESEQRRGMRYRDAAPYLVLLSLPGVDADDIADVLGRGVVLPRRREDLQSIADACSIVSLLRDGVLPSLRAAPADAGHLVMLDACARNLRGHGVAVGGWFYVSCAEVVQRVGSYAAFARGDGGEDEDTLRGCVDELLGLAGRFLDTTYTPDPEAAGTAEGGN